MLRRTLALVAMGSLFVACGGGGQPETLKADPIDRFECRQGKGERVADPTRYSDRATPTVWRVLEDVRQRQCWSEALLVAGHIGGPENYARLVDFIEGRSKNLVLSEDLVFVQTAFQALAEMARGRGESSTPGDTGRRQSMQALEFLIETSNPGAWEKRTAAWSMDTVIKRELIRTLTLAAVRALGSVNLREKPDGLFTTPAKAQEAMLDKALAASATASHRFKFKDTDAPTDAIAKLINLRVIPPGRVAYAMKEALARIRERAATLVNGISAKEREIKRLRGPEERARHRKAVDDYRSYIDGIRNSRARREARESLRELEQQLRKGERSLCGQIDDHRREGRAIMSLRTQAQVVLDEALDTFELEQRWLAMRRGEKEWLKMVADANKLADVRLDGLYGQLRSLRDLLDGTENRQAIDDVEAVVFPEGPLRLMNAALPEQVKFVLAACDELEARHADELRRLKLEDHVKVTRQAHRALDKALRSGMIGEGYYEVIRARARLQIRLRELVARIIVDYPGYVAGAPDRSKPGTARREDDWKLLPEHQKTRNLVLEPILNQDEQIAGYLKRRVSVRDVHPDSGQELDPLEEGGAIDRSQEPGVGDAESLRETLRKSYRNDASGQ